MKMTVNICDFCGSQIPDDFEGGRFDHRRLRVQEGIVQYVGFFQRPKVVWRDIIMCECCVDQIINKSTDRAEKK